MTLEELTDYVCTKSGLIEPDDREACELFLSKRYELIYNSYLWKDSLVGVDVTFDPDDDDNAEGIVLLPEVIGRVVAVRTADGDGSYGNSVKIHSLEEFYRIDYDEFSQTGTATKFVIMSPLWFVWRAAGSETGLHIVTPSSADAEVEAKITYRNQAGVRTVFNDAMGDFSATGTRLEIESFFKPETLGATQLAPIGSSTAEASLAATDTRSPSYQRLRLFSIPDVETTLKVLGKKKFVPLDFDQEEPEIKNLDNCLIAFAMGDMLKRARQFGKAQAELQEGALLLQELAKLEVLQAAHNSRFIPSDGFGDPYFSPSNHGNYWL